MKKTAAIIFVFFIAIAFVFCSGWEVLEERDDFGDPTGKKEIVLLNQQGTFNSSPAGVTGGKLEWELHCNDNIAWFILKENGADLTLSTAYLKSDSFTVKIKRDDGIIENLSATLDLNGSSYNKVVLKSAYGIERICADNSSLKIVISCDNGNGSYSLGNIDSSGTEELFFTGKSIMEEVYEAKTHLDFIKILDELKTLDVSSSNYYGNKISEFYKESFKVNLPGYAGGIIIYDCDADNNYGNADGLRSQECGWRYLEAAPADLKIVDWTPTVDASMDGYMWASNTDFLFGFYKRDDEILHVNGTGTAIGMGESNTKRLVNAIGLDAYERPYEKRTTAKYAARLCDELIVYSNDGGTYDDWFLPSKDELSLFMEKTMEYVHFFNIVMAGSYWTSSEDETSAFSAYSYNFYSKTMKSDSRGSYNRIRPFRTF